PGGDEPPGKVQADEPGAAEQQHVHDATTPPSRVLDEKAIADAQGQTPRVMRTCPIAYLMVIPRRDDALVAAQVRDPRLNPRRFGYGPCAPSGDRPGPRTCGRARSGGGSARPAPAGPRCRRRPAAGRPAG